MMITFNRKLYVSQFDNVKLFPSIDNESGLQAAKNALEAREQQCPTALCIIEALEFSSD